MCPLSLEEARRLVSKFVEKYNNEHLHSAIGYITPKDKLEGNEDRIFKTRDRKLQAAREARKKKCQALKINCQRTKDEEFGLRSSKTEIMYKIA